MIAVSGTAPIDDEGKTVGLNDPAAQMRQCLEIVRAALEEAGAGLEDVVRLRTLLTRIADWSEVAAVYREYFKEVLPANTVVEVSRFIELEWLVEIEVDAILGSE